jgi:hypothetical protein
MRGRDRAIASGAVRLGAASENAHHHDKRQDRPYAENQLQVKNGVLIGIWDEAELAAIRQRIEQRAKS